MAYPQVTLFVEIIRLRWSRKSTLPPQAQQLPEYWYRTDIDALVYHFFRGNPTRMIFKHIVDFQ